MATEYKLTACKVCFTNHMGTTLLQDGCQSCSGTCKYTHSLYNTVSDVPFTYVYVHIIIFYGFQPMAREYQNGDGFGYILAFRRKDTSSWTTVRAPHVESSRYVYYNDSLTPYSPFEVKIKAFNRRGEGPFSQIAIVHSAEEGEPL